MRLACGLAIALWLTFPAAGFAQPGSAKSWLAQQPDAAGVATPPAGQAPAEPVAGQNAPAETPPAAGKKAPASAASAGAATKHPKRKVPPPAPDAGPRKIVVREGGASEPTAQIVPGMTPEEAARQRQDAEQFLGATADQLKQVTERTLNAQQQETVGQIHNYMDGSRAALKEGDVRRARTLAQKAHLLAEDLVKH